jgi:glycogen debranching enzyme
MIALPGLFLVTGRHEDAKKILRAFARSLRQGMLPDRLPAQGEEPEFTSADASLWLFVASWKYLQATGDETFVRETLLPALRKVIHWYEKGTLPGGNLEIKALWVNALSVLADLEERLGDPDEAKRFAQQAKQAQKSFVEAFGNEERPEQIFVLSLPFPVLPKPKAARLLAAIEEKVRAQTELLGPYLTALVRVHGAAGRKKGLAVIEALKPRLAEAGIGSGAWSVAEVLRVYVEDLRGGEKPAPKRRGKKEA